MDVLFFLLFLLSLFCLIAGLVKPNTFNKIFKKELNRKSILKIFGSSLVFSFIAFGIATPDSGSKGSSVSEKIIKKEIVNEQKIEKEEKDEIDNDVENKNTEPDNIKTEPVDNQSQNNDTETQLNEPQQETKNQNSSEVLYSVVSVVDGDTIKVNMDGTTETLRLIGIDTPESVHPTKPVECFGIEASNRAKELLNGKKVKLEKDPSQGERDKYGRLLVYVIMEDGVNFNKKMIKDGYAYEYTYNTPYKYQAEFKQAQVDAKNNKRGLWADGACVEKIEEVIEQTVAEQEKEQTPQIQSDGYKWYVSSHYSSKQYYCETDEAWKDLSKKYLKEYSSEAELLRYFPNHTLHEPCQ